MTARPILPPSSLLRSASSLCGTAVLPIAPREQRTRTMACLTRVRALAFLAFLRTRRTILPPLAGLTRSRPSASLAPTAFRISTRPIRIPRSEFRRPSAWPPPWTRTSGARLACGSPVPGVLPAPDLSLARRLTCIRSRRLPVSLVQRLRTRRLVAILRAPLVAVCSPRGAMTRRPTTRAGATSPWPSCSSTSWALALSRPVVTTTTTRVSTMSSPVITTTLTSSRSSTAA